MNETHTGFGPAYLSATTSSFTEFLGRARPDLVPQLTASVPGAELLAPHGTTIVALRDAEGVVMAGDRRATIGNLIASRTMQKVFQADSDSVMGIAGTAGLAIELVRLFQLELEHYEKIEGTTLSLEGKANRLSGMLRANLSLAMQGLTVVPLFAGVDSAVPGEPPQGRIFSFDVIGGKYEELEYHAVGSGSGFARGAIKKLWRPGLGRDAAIRVAIEALYDAADDDSATGGPDLPRRIFPVVYTVGAAGAARVDQGEVGRVSARVVTERTEEEQ